MTRTGGVKRRTGLCSHVETASTTETQLGRRCKHLTAHNNEGVKQGSVQSVCVNFREPKCTQDLEGNFYQYAEPREEHQVTTNDDTQSVTH